jgi:hypothetical protein
MTLIVLLVAWLLYGQRIAIPFGEKQIPAILPIFWAALLLLVARRRARVSRSRLLFSCLAVGVMTTTLLFSTEGYSVLSFLYIFAIYIPVLFRWKDDGNNVYNNVIRFYRNFMLSAAILGILQFSVQLLGLPYLDLADIVPEIFLQKGYATTYPIIGGSPLLKSNGIFFLEPSFFSQYLAIALFIEIMLSLSVKRIFLLFAALLMTFSGTGPLMLIVAAPFIISRNLFGAQKSRVIRFLQAVLICSGFLIFFLQFFGDAFTRRAETEGRPGSSAHMRFVRPYELAFETYEADARRMLTGIGPGLADDMPFSHEANFGIIPKLLIEYGIVACFLFLLFISLSFFYRVKWRALCFVLFFKYLLLSGAFLEPQTAFLCYSLGWMTAMNRVPRGTVREWTDSQYRGTVRR